MERTGADRSGAAGWQLPEPGGVRVITDPHHEPSGVVEPFLPSDWREPVGAGADRFTTRGSRSGSGHRRSATAAALAPWSPDLHPPSPRELPSREAGLGWRLAGLLMAAALLGAVIGGGMVAATSDRGGGTTTIRQISAGPALLNGTTNIESVIAKVLPAVVSIDAISPGSSTQLLFGGQQEEQGTGMIITPSGEVVTNNHVISGATSITATLFGSLRALPVTVIETDPTDDVALLQIDNASDLPTVSYGNSDDVQVGDAVVAIGNALGLSAGTPTVTQGIISAKGRTVQAGDAGGATTETLGNMFQTDAAINPGNSGGPLVDSSGRVIGMNTAVASSADGTSQAQNIGFAIPSNKIGGLLPALRTRSVPNPAISGTAFLGVSLETLTPQVRSAYNFVPVQGAVVLLVQSGTPADAAGLHQGDVIVSFDRTTVTSADQLTTAIQTAHPGQVVTIGLYRGQTEMTVSATLGSTSQHPQRAGG